MVFLEAMYETLFGYVFDYITPQELYQVVAWNVLSFFVIKALFVKKSIALGQAIVLYLLCAGSDYFLRTPELKALPFAFQQAVERTLWIYTSGILPLAFHEIWLRWKIFECDTAVIYSGGEPQMIEKRRVKVGLLMFKPFMYDISEGNTTLVLRKNGKDVLRLKGYFLSNEPEVQKQVSRYNIENIVYSCHGHIVTISQHYKADEAVR